MWVAVAFLGGVIVGAIGSGWYFLRTYDFEHAPTELWEDE